MGESKIEWTEQTWNPIVGCSIVSPGCTNCYAMRMAARLERMDVERYAGLTKPSKAGPVWTGELRLVEEALTIPLRRRKPTTYFVNSMSDLFHENVPDEWIDRVFAVMALAPQHTFQVLTKRSARMRSYLSSDETAGRMTRLLAHGLDGIGSLQIETCNDGSRGFMLPNVWLGVSAERQEEADERVPDLLATPAAVRFVSAEPLLEPIDFTLIDDGAAHREIPREEWGPVDTDDSPPALWWNTLTGERTIMHGGLDGSWSRIDARLDWIIVGGESGRDARPMHPAWVRAIRDQCAEAGTAFHFKQWGEWAPGECAGGPATRTERTASQFDSRWSFCELTPRESEGMHTEDEPDLYRLGKARAGRLLDGVEHNGIPSLHPAPGSALTIGGGR